MYTQCLSDVADPIPTITVVCTEYCSTTELIPSRPLELRARSIIAVGYLLTSDYVIPFLDFCCYSMYKFTVSKGLPPR